MATVDITSLGAPRDGSVSIKTILQNAIGNAVSLGGGSIFFPRGTYIVDGIPFLHSPNVTVTPSGNGILVTLTNKAP